MKVTPVLVVLSLALVAVAVATDDEWDDLSHMQSFLSDEDCKSKRRNNEGKCGAAEDGSFTCSCLDHEKPAYSKSMWLPSIEQRRFSHKCEKIKLPYNEDTCTVLLGNPKGDKDWEFYCPNNGFLQTWGAFCATPQDHHIRLWYRCCNVECPKWNCVWTPTTVAQKPFELMLNDTFVQGVRGTYVHEKKDGEWSLQLCFCDLKSQHEEL